MGLIRTIAVMVYAPRERNERDVVTSILCASYRFPSEAPGGYRSTRK
jgi:hypothetical protein